MTRTRKFLGLIGLVLTFSLIAAACSSDDDDSAADETGSTPAAAEADPARLRVAHIYSSDAAPEPTVDVYASTGTIDAGTDEPVVSDLEYGTITDYLEVPADSYNIGVYVAGTDTEVDTFSGIELAEGSQTTAVAERASVDSQDFSLNTIDENSLDVPTTGNAAVTAYHGVPLSAADGVRIGAAGAGCLADGAQLDYQQQATVEVPAGTYELGVFGADDTECSGSALIGPAEVTVEDEVGYLVFAYGVDPAELSLLPAEIG